MRPCLNAEVSAMTRRTFLVPLFAAAFVLAPAQLSGQVTSSGPFEVSPRSYGFTVPGRYDTKIPTVAALMDGSFVVAWEEDLEVVPPEGNSHAFFDVYARKVSARGTPGRLVRVERGSPEMDRGPELPELTADGRGGFVLAWERLDSEGSDVLYQRIPAGRFVREEGGRILRTAEGPIDRYPAVAANAAGAWVIAWEEWQDFHGLHRTLGLRAFQASGQPATEEIRIASPDPEVALVRPRVAIQPDGSFLVVWGAFSGTKTPRLQGRSFAADGTPLGPVFQVALGVRSWEALTGNEADGEFLVAWENDALNGKPVLRLRRYSTEGQRIATVVLGRNLRSWRLDSNREGETAVVWTDARGFVRGRVLNRDAIPPGPPFLVTEVSDNPWIGDLVFTDDGKIFLAWIGRTEVTAPGGATHLPILGQIWEVGD
jgi:hypothetical protein